jgi:hypothetical protein
LAGRLVLPKGKHASKVWNRIKACENRLRGGKMVMRNSVPFKGPALFGLAAVLIACLWIYLLFTVIPALFNGPSAS